MTSSTALNAARRTSDLAALGDGATVDVVVIGGGITGTGIALDAATRGLSVVLVEKHDLAFGTSRWSSKLVHGGLRYLATGNVGIARRSAIERGILMTRNAPHLVKAMPQLVPLLPSMNSVLARVGAVRLRRGRRVAQAGGHPVVDAAAVAPDRRRAGDRVGADRAPRRADGGLLAYDGQLIDDARLVTAVARTAAQHGARILTHVGASDATGTSVRLTDQLTGESLEVSARAVINAAGVWAGDVDTSIRLRPSRGTHLVFDAAAFGNPTAALTIPIPGELNRFVFAMPEQLGRVYLGLTDEDAPGPIPDVPEPTSAEVDVPARHRQHRARRRAGTRRRDRRLCRAAAADRHRRGPHGRRVARARRRRVARRRDQRDRRQADRIPLHGAGRSGPGRHAARPDGDRVPYPQPAAGRCAVESRCDASVAGRTAVVAGGPLRCRGAQRHRVRQL